MDLIVYLSTLSLGLLCVAFAFVPLLLCNLLLTAQNDGGSYKVNLHYI